MSFLFILNTFIFPVFAAKPLMKSNLDLHYFLCKIFQSFPSHFTCPNTEKSGKGSSKFAASRSSYLLFLTWVLWVSVIFGNSNEKMAVLQTRDSIQIREVWNHNLQYEFGLIREIVDDFPYVAMDTEFPGVVLKPLGTYKNPNDYHFFTLKANVELLKLIQLGLTFSDKNGNLPTCGTGKYCVWQFNFREFNINEDVYAHDSIVLLTQSGIDFYKNREEGVDVMKFSELLMSSGVVLNDNMQWVTFHSGYDFGYLLKLLICQDLPDTRAGFFDLLKLYFPNLYDTKHMMRFSNSLHGGLNKLAELLDVERVGICHQAGSDSLLTSCTFFKLRDNFLNGETEKYAGVLYGLGDNGDNPNYW